MLAIKNNRGASIMEALSMLPVVVGLLGWSIWFGIETGLWYWCVLMSTILLAVVIMEVVSLIMMGRTISQQFWDWSKKKVAGGKRPNAWKAWTMIGMLIVGWLFLMLHLAWKMLTT